MVGRLPFTPPTDRLAAEGTLNYTYDAAGNLASMASGDGNVAVSYTWWSARRILYQWR